MTAMPLTTLDSLTRNVKPIGYLSRSNLVAEGVGHFVTEKIMTYCFTLEVITFRCACDTRYVVRYVMTVTRGRLTGALISHQTLNTSGKVLKHYCIEFGV